MNSSFSSTISQTNPDIMEYLSQKLEAKSKEMMYFKQLISGIFDFQSFQFYKKNVIAIFTEIEDDLKQASYGIKGLFIENKALTLEIDQLKDRVLSLEENNKNYINDLCQSHNYLMAENAELKEQLLICNNNMNNSISNSNSNSNTIQIDHYDYNKHLSNITEEAELEIPIKKLMTQESEGSSNNNKNRHYNRSNKDNNSNSNSNSHSNRKKNEGRLNNVNDIISDMKNNKKKLKEAIKRHFKGHHQNSKYDIDSSGEEVERNISNDYKTINNDKWREKKSSEILKKVMGNKAAIETLNKGLGKEFMKKMIRIDCSDDYLLKIESILNGKNKSSMNKDKLPMRIRNSKSRSTSKSFSKNTQPMKKDKQRALSTSYIQQPTPTVTPPMPMPISQEKEAIKTNYSFENTLRDYSKNKCNNNQIIEESKPKFNHYLNPYGKYFTNPNDQGINIRTIKR